MHLNPCSPAQGCFGKVIDRVGGGTLPEEVGHYKQALRLEGLASLSACALLPSAGGLDQSAFHPCQHSSLPWWNVSSVS